MHSVFNYYLATKKVQPGLKYVSSQFGWHISGGCGRKKVAFPHQQQGCPCSFACSDTSTAAITPRTGCHGDSFYLAEFEATGVVSVCTRGA